jgi:hypothetical protein
MEGAMGCILLNYCHFFADYMKELPKTAAYMKENLCRNNHEACSRYKIYAEYGLENIPSGLDPEDTRQLEKIRDSLREKQNKG